MKGNIDIQKDTLNKNSLVLKNEQNKEQVSFYRNSEIRVNILKYTN